MKSILDRSFRYTPSFETDLRKTFERIRLEQRKQPPERTVAQPPNAKVLVLATPRNPRAPA
jgi:hypothetical protein